jgi:hypothetical protein
MKNLELYSNGEIIIYQTEDGLTKIETQYVDENIWLTQAQMAELFQTTKQNVVYHLKNIFEEGELNESSVVKDFFTTAADGKNYNTNFYNLDVVISVGYRVKSHRGTQFRIWAMEVLKEYLKKGFVMNDELLKEAGGGKYWHELLQRIREIRSSEKVFYRQILDIFATSIDYDPKIAIAQQFFQTIQNKMHYAAHGNTSAEVIRRRVDHEKPFMGLTHFKGLRPTKAEVLIAKNYLSEEEINILNRLVAGYLEYAELQAARRKQMSMSDWVTKLDDFMKFTESELLYNSGLVSRIEAENKALAEYEKYKTLTKDELSRVEMDFLEFVKKLPKELPEDT